MERNPSGHNDKKVMPSESNRVSAAQLEVNVNPKPTDSSQPNHGNNQAPSGGKIAPKSTLQPSKSEDYTSDYTRLSILGDPNNPKPHNLKITYEKVAVTSASFVQHLQKDVDYANNILGPLPEQVKEPGKQVVNRIRWKVNLMEFIKKDILFKFKVRLFGVEWT